MAYLHVNHPTQIHIDDLRKMIAIKTDISRELHSHIDTAVNWVKELSNSDDDNCVYDDEYIVKGLVKAVERLEKWLSSKPSGWIAEHCEQGGSQRSWERCDGEWRGQSDQLEDDNITAFMQLFSADNFCYLLACSALGAGVGFWEIFDDLPDMNTIV